MAHFAEIDENKIVVRVLVIANEQEHRGQEFLANELGLGGTWIQTSYNSKIRGNFAGAGYVYLSEEDLFMPPKPFDSWLLDKESASWVAPISKPEPIEGGYYTWDDDSQAWIFVEVYEDDEQLDNA